MMILIPYLPYAQIPVQEHCSASLIPSCSPETYIHSKGQCSGARAAPPLIRQPCSTEGWHVLSHTYLLFVFRASCWFIFAYEKCRHEYTYIPLCLWKFCFKKGIYTPTTIVLSTIVVPICPPFDAPVPQTLTEEKKATCSLGMNADLPVMYFCTVTKL